MLETRADKCNAGRHIVTSRPDHEHSASVEVMEALALRSCACETVENCPPGVLEIGH